MVCCRNFSLAVGWWHLSPYKCWVVRTQHDGLENREGVGAGKPIEADGLNRKEVVLWNMTVVASEVVSSDDSRRAVYGQPPSRKDHH
jgi:hypothetical protein